jgi:hypothetical protein
VSGVATVVANGSDDVLDLWNNPWGTSLRDRVAPVLQGNGYQVLDFTVNTSFDLGSIIGGLTYPYQATIRLETGSNPNTLAGVRDAISAALLSATGYAPTSIAVTSAGQEGPAALPASWLDSLAGKVNGILGTALTGIQLILIAVALGIVALIYWIAKNPKQARSLV